MRILQHASSDRKIQKRERWIKEEQGPREASRDRMRGHGGTALWQEGPSVGSVGPSQELLLPCTDKCLHLQWLPP